MEKCNAKKAKRDRQKQTKMNIEDKTEALISAQV